MKRSNFIIKKRLVKKVLVNRSNNILPPEILSQSLSTTPTRILKKKETLTLCWKLSIILCKVLKTREEKNIYMIRFAKETDGDVLPVE